jgi:hypothetical protein
MTPARRRRALPRFYITAALVLILGGCGGDNVGSSKYSNYYTGKKGRRHGKEAQRDIERSKNTSKASRI